MGNKYLSPEMGFAMGINYILQTGFSIPAELSAIAVMISYWDPVQSHLPIYIAVFLIFPVGLNLAGVK